MKGQIKSLKENVVRFQWEKPGYPVMFPLPLNEFFFKVEEAEK